MGRVVTLDKLAVALSEARRAGRRVVLTNGCFDLLHVGHVRVLQEARALGDVLVVGVNSDESVRQLKGPARPLVTAEERAEVLAALTAVDYAVVFDEPTAECLAALVRPDVYVKGADYATSGPSDGRGGPDIDTARLPEARVVAEAGGRTVLVPLTPGRSTSDLVQRIRAGATPS
jgi:D-glycero-beta-D-manno-heptose 1-phosphate adenylyltransferase